MADEQPNVPSEGDRPTQWREGERVPEQPDRGPLHTAGEHSTGGGVRTPGRPVAYLQPGRVLMGQFEIVRPLGRGGMGVVYEAKNLLTGDRVALKTILPGHLTNPKARERFIREIRTVRRLRHPGIVAIFDTGQEDDCVFFTMELLHGRTLREIMKQRGPMELRETVRILRQVCQALEHAHRRVVHRDLSPENIMVLEDGTIRVLDFGLARVREREGMSMTRTAVGKAMYMAPEQRRDAAHVDKRADIYSLGVLYFEMLTGQLPRGHVTAGVLRPDLPPECDELLARSLVGQDARIATAREFREGLEHCLECLGRKRRPTQEEERTEPEEVPDDAMAAELIQDAEGARDDRRWRKRMLLYSLELVTLLLVAVPVLATLKYARYSWLAIVGSVAGGLVTRRYLMEFLRKRITGAPGAQPRRKRSFVRALGCLAALVAVVILGGAWGISLLVRNTGILETARDVMGTVDATRAQAETAPGGEIERSVRLGGGVEMQLVWIPPGEFRMGSEQGSKNEQPVHEVAIPKGFWMGKYEVTRAQYEALMGYDPSTANDSPLNKARMPVEYMSVDSCREFLDEASRRAAGVTFRLPTEAEWEYACRAGSTGEFCFGDDADGLEDYGWYRGNAGNWPRPVGRKKPNAWGLHDMHGNVAEWCRGYALGDYTQLRSDAESSEQTSRNYFVIRGGAFNDQVEWCRTARRVKPWAPVSGVWGFRVVCEDAALPEPPRENTAATPTPSVETLRDIDSGLVAYYPFDGSYSDRSGNGFDGQVQGASLCPDRHGVRDSACVLSGAGSAIRFQQRHDYAERTVCLWLRLDSTADAVVATNDGPGNRYGAFKIQVKGGSIRLHAGGHDNHTDAARARTGTWIHVALVQTSDQRLVYYLNGQALATRSANSVASSNGTGIFRMGEGRLGNLVFCGAIDEVRVYRRALSAEDVSDVSIR